MFSSRINEQSLTLLESAPLAAHGMGDVSANLGASSQAVVRRGMTVHTSEGHSAGHVAAVVLDQEQQEVVYVLLVRECQLREYRLIPVELIKQVDDVSVLLHILQPQVDTLAVRHGP